MRAIAIEFGYSETTFVLPPRDPSNTAWVRIFTPGGEVSFAGNSNVGTAFVLAREAEARGDAVPERLVFEEAAGRVRINLLRENATVVGAELTAPEALSRWATVEPDRAAACLSLAAGDVRTDTHAPQVVSVGLPFLVAELASRDALRRAKPDPEAYEGVFPLDGAGAVYAYTRDVGTAAPEAVTDLQARMFGHRMTEDPATGGASAAAAALLAEARGKVDLRLRVGQGVDMGRPSLMLARAGRQGGLMMAYVGGRCVTVMEGSFTPSYVSPAGGPARSEAAARRGSLRRTAFVGLVLVAAVAGAGMWFMPGRELLSIGAAVSSVAMLVAAVKLYVSAVPNRWTDRLKVLAEAGALSAAVLAFVFFVDREGRLERQQGGGARIGVTINWLSTQTMRELVVRLYNLERRSGVVPEARVESRLLCPRP